jgi:hypothetical protein
LRATRFGRGVDHCSTFIGVAVESGGANHAHRDARRAALTLRDARRSRRERHEVSHQRPEQGENRPRNEAKNSTASAPLIRAGSIGSSPRAARTNLRTQTAHSRATTCSRSPRVRRWCSLYASTSRSSDYNSTDIGTPLRDNNTGKSIRDYAQPRRRIRPKKPQRQTTPHQTARSTLHNPELVRALPMRSYA